MEKDGNNYLIYTVLFVLFFGILGLIAFGVYYLLPKNLAVMAIGLIGLVVMTAGPFWATSMERNIREFVTSKSNNN